MKKTDIARSYHRHSRHRPTINVKHHYWVRDIVREYRDNGHEFSGDTRFFDWVLEQYDNDGGQYGGPLDIAGDIANECGWGDAKEVALEIFGDRADVYSEGRSGGWLVVGGIGDPDDWDLMDINAWSRFDRCVRDILADLDYQYVWHLYVNVYEPTVLEPLRDEAEAGMLADADMLAAIVGSMS